jgi:preprotein translocase subunit YajC
MQFLAQAQGGAPAYSGMLLMVGMFVILYFFMIRPQQKRAKEHQAMLGTLGKGDRVLTTGGIYGSVIGVKDDVVVLRIDENCKVEVALQNVTAKLER